jgi:DNA-binding CsgD family transcriptional regulator
VTAKRVTIRAAADDASRIRSMLEWSGFAVDVVIEEGEAPSLLAWAVAALANGYALTDREREVLACVLDGLDTRAIVQAMQIGRSTVKWHLHNVFVKTRTQNREDLLRVALLLPRLASSSSTT